MTVNAGSYAENVPVLGLEAGLANYLACLQKVADDSRDGLIVTNTDGQILLFSNVSAGLFGYEPCEVVGQNIAILMQDTDRRHHGEYIHAYRKSGKGRILGIGPREICARHKSGFALQIEISISEVSWNGWALFVALCRDISARVEREQTLKRAHDELEAGYARLQKANEELEAYQHRLATLNERLKSARDEAQAANGAKSDFLAMMSHELRTPLNGVMGMTQVLAGTRLDRAQREYLDVIVRSSETLLVLLNDLLDIAKAEAGRIAIEPRSVELPAFLREIADCWKLRCEAKGIGFEFAAENTIPQAAGIDPVRVRQILDNLLSNALKFTASGTITFRAATARLAAGEELCFDVVDTGIGIAPEYHEKIFDSFIQADNSITRRFGGTGLGLAICRKLVSLMGGEIWVQSAPGQGSRFGVRIPCRQVCDDEQASAAVAPKRADDRSGPWSKANILVAEDNALNQKVIAAVLETLDCRFHIAQDGREAVAQLGCGEFDLVLMDLHMPNMDGIEATRAIRARTDAARDIPIIGLTASAMTEDRARCIAAGMSAFISKPFAICDLQALLAKFAPRDAGRNTAPETADGQLTLAAHVGGGLRA